MNRFGSRLAQILGSMRFIIVNFIFFGIWIVAHYIYGFDPSWTNLTVVLSLEAIFLALLILRAENVQVGHIEQLLEREVRQENKELELLEEIDKQTDDSKSKRKE